MAGSNDREVTPIQGRKLGLAQALGQRSYAGAIIGVVAVQRCRMGPVSQVSAT